MGCDIHLITQIKNKDKWEYVEDVPTTLTQRNYFNFAVLAGVRNSFDTQGFKPKGLPDDMDVKKFDWKSEFESIKDSYNNFTATKCRLPDGEYIGELDERLKRYCSDEEYSKWQGTKGHNEQGAYVFDAAQVGGEICEVPYKDLFTFEEYLKEYYSSDYDEELDDYGSYNVDFTCEDYHTPSYLTLKELEDFDYSDILQDKVKVSKHFIDKFFELGGKLPDGMKLNKDWKPQDIRECFQQAYDPVYIVSWRSSTKTNEIDLFVGIDELREIAKKYDKESENVRIVFAFDN